MKIHFDDIIYTLQSQGGISTFWSEITNRIRNSKKIEIETSNGSQLSRFSPVLSASDVFHSSYFRTPLSRSRKIKTVVTVHDLIYEESIETNKSPNILLNTWQRRNAIERADAIVCVSHTTKKYLLDYYPSYRKRESDISVIYHGISFDLQSIDRASEASDRIEQLFQQTNKQYVLFVGGRQNYKNFDKALEGFNRSKLRQEKDYFFVCTGKDFEPEEIALIERLDLLNKVKIIPKATTKEMVALYRYAHALLYISSKEGFGIPPLEAMSCKCPVIISTCEAVVEIVDDAGIVINIDDVFSIASAIDFLLKDEVRQNYISLGEARIIDFDWDMAAQKYMEIYDFLHQNR